MVLLLLFAILRPILRPLMYVFAFSLLSEAPGWFWVSFVNPQASSQTTDLLNGLGSLLMVALMLIWLARKLKPKKRKPRPISSYPVHPGYPPPYPAYMPNGYGAIPLSAAAADFPQVVDPAR